MDQGVLSLTDWVENLLSDGLLALMIGCPSDSLPPLGSHYGFTDRIWLRYPEFEKFGRNNLFLYN